MKIEVGFNKIARADDLDVLAKILFPTNRDHQFIFLAIFVELKWAKEKPLPTLDFIIDKYNIGRRSFEKVRSRLRLAGIIEHVSRLSPKCGYKEGWVLSSRFTGSLRRLADIYEKQRNLSSENQEDKDRFSLELCRNSWQTFCDHS